MASGISRAQEFAVFAEQQGWKVERTVDAGLKTVTARREGESVTAQWLDNHALGPIGAHSYPGGNDSIKNAASAKRILSVPEGHYPEPKKRQPQTRTKKTPGKRKPLPFDPSVAADDEIIAAVLGKKVSWINHHTSSFSQIEDSGYVPLERGRHLKIELSRGKDTFGERILTFCDARGGGFRSCFVVAITRVGR